MTDQVAEAQVEAVDEGAERAPAKPLTRREFLYYLWGISLSVFMAGSGGATLWFTLPRFREGEFGGIFTLDIGEIPAPDTGPVGFAEGRFWLVNIGSQSVDDERRPEQYPAEQGVMALYMVCVHLGCLYKWVPVNDRFECPCHGSKYLKTGERVDGPATRNLDVFVIELVDAQGNVLAKTEPTLNDRDGSALQVPPEATAMRIDTGTRIQGHLNNQPGGGF